MNRLEPTRLWQGALISGITVVLLMGLTWSALGATLQLELWTNFGTDFTADMLDDLIDEYNRLHPETRVVHRAIAGDLAERYKVAVAGGVTPDIGWVSIDWFMPLYQEDIVVPIEHFADRDGLDLNQFWPGLWGTGVGGRQWGYPFEVGSEAMIYNKDWFDSAGIGEAPKTWDEYLETAKRLTDPERGRFGVYPAWPGYIAIQWIWRNGGALISEDLTTALFTKPETVEATQWYADLHRVHNVVGGDIAGGSAAMFVVHPSWYEFSKSFPFAVGTAPAPVPENGTRASLSYYKELVIFKTDQERQEAAWRFIQWLMEPEQQAKWATTTGYLPVNRYTLEVPLYMEYLDNNPGILPWIDELPYARNFPTTPVYGQLLGMFEGALQRVAQGEAAHVVMESMQQVAQGIIDAHLRGD